jgi:hypothetical protein
MRRPAILLLGILFEQAAAVAPTTVRNATAPMATVRRVARSAARIWTCLAFGSLALLLLAATPVEGATRTGAVLPPLHNEAALRDLVIVNQDETIALYDTALVRSSHGDEKTLLELKEPRLHWRRDALATREDGSWTFGTAAFDAPGAVDVTFVSRGGARSDCRVTNIGVPLVWAVLAEEQPLGVLLAGRDDVIEVLEVTPEGTNVAGRLRGVETFYPPAVSITRLADHRIVITALNGDPRVADGVVLYVVSGGGVKTLRLPPANLRSRIEELAAAAGTGSLVCIVARDADERAAVAAINVDADASTSFRPLLSDEQHASTVSVVHADSFVVAWIDGRDGSVWMRRVTAGGVAGDAVSLVRQARRSPLLSLRAARGGVTVVAKPEGTLTLWTVGPDEPGGR